MTNVNDDAINASDGAPPHEGRGKWWLAAGGIVAVIVVAIAIFAVSRDSTGSEGATPTTTAQAAGSTSSALRTTSTVANTTSAKPTIAPSTTASTAPPATDVNLITLHGIGPTTYGMSMDDASAKLVPSFGSPSSDGTRDGCIVARTVAWDGVAISGGPTPDNTFRGFGWTVAQGGPALHTASGYGRDLAAQPIDRHLAAVRADWPGAQLNQADSSAAQIRVTGDGGSLVFEYTAAGGGFVLYAVGGGEHDPNDPDPYGCS